MEYENRHIAGISESDGKIIGYPIVFNVPSEIITERGRRFREVIEPGAVANALATGTDVRALVDHDKRQILGRTKSGTLRYSIDDKGVRVEIDPPQSAAAVVESIRRQDVAGMSFSFAVAKGGEVWDRSGDVPLRRITNIAAIPEFSVTSYPAYSDTTVAIRSLDALPSLSLQNMRLRLAAA